MKRVFICIFLCGLTYIAARSQNIALKTNLLYWATTSFNAGAEVKIAKKVDSRPVCVLQSIHLFRQQED